MAEDLRISWKRGFRGSSICEPEVVFNELESIRKKNKGELRKEDIVKTAENKRSKLHKFFEWDDSVASNEYRKWQAGRLVSSIEVVRTDAEDLGSMRHYQITRSALKPKEKSYKTIDDIMDDPEQRAELINRALSELLAVRRRYHQIQELSIVFRAIDDVLESYQPS